MIWAYALIFGTTFVLGLSAAFALGWAGRTGQFSNMKAGSEIIFDKDEPIGTPTDQVLPVTKFRFLTPRPVHGQNLKA